MSIFKKLLSQERPIWLQNNELEAERSVTELIDTYRSLMDLDLSPEGLRPIPAFFQTILKKALDQNSKTLGVTKNTGEAIFWIEHHTKEEIMRAPMDLMDAVSKIALALTHGNLSEIDVESHHNNGGLFSAKYHDKSFVTASDLEKYLKADGRKTFHVNYQNKKYELFVNLSETKLLISIKKSK